MLFQIMSRVWTQSGLPRIPTSKNKIIEATVWAGTGRIHLKSIDYFRALSISTSPVFHGTFDTIRFYSVGMILSIR